MGSRDRGWNAGAALARIRRFTDAVDEPNSKYRKAFTLVTGDKDDFGSYKLPIADVIEDTLTAIPRGIFAAAGVLQGARGGVDATDAEKAGARKHLSRYYSKMREEFDDDDLIAPWERASFELAYRDVLATEALSIETIREFESFLRDVGYSKDRAKAFIAKGAHALDLREAGESSVWDDYCHRWAGFRDGLKRKV